MKKTRSRAGFTLAELLIVVAIVAVLVSIAIPVFAGGREQASATQCLANRTMIEYAVKVNQMLASDFEDEPDSSIVDPILAAAASDGGTYFAGACKCNEGGMYDYNYEEGRVTCTVHTEGGGGSGGGSKPQYAVHVDVHMALANMRDEIAQDKEAFKKKHGITNNNLGNTVLRGLIRNQEYGGEWPALSADLQEKSGYTMQLYVQPFFSESLSRDESILYANQNKETDSWSAWLVGHYEEDSQTIAWYKRVDGKTTMLTGDYKTQGWKFFEQGVESGTYVKIN